MKAMQVGAATALVVLIVADARAQQYSGVVPGTCVNGSITSDAVVSPSGVAGGLPVAPAIPGTFVGESIVSGGIVGQPISGGLATASPVVSSLTTSPAQGQILPYSYWVSAPQPARMYVEYGAIDQFPFQGRAYGSPNDRWSWYYMGGGESRYLARYYYPPLR